MQLQWANFKLQKSTFLIAKDYDVYTNKVAEFTGDILLYFTDIKHLTMI